MKEWYCLYTKPHAEHQVAALLESRDIETYLPTLTPSARMRGRNKRPFFPCYLFARIDFQTIASADIRWTPGLRRIIAFDTVPARIPASLIKVIRRKVETYDGKRDRTAHNFTPGESVQMTDGPLQGMVATFDNQLSSSQRVQVLLQILGRTCRVQVDTVRLEKIASNSASSETPDKRPWRKRGRDDSISLRT